MKWVTLIVLILALAGFVVYTHDGVLPEAVAPDPTLRPIAARSLPTPTPPPASGIMMQGHAAYNYVCFLPRGSDKSERRSPLIFFLHGQRDQEDLESLRRFGPIAYALDQKEFPFIIAAPATGRGWYIPDLKITLEAIMSRYPIDPDRVYLTGLSMGGHATWSFAIAYPQLFAAIAPVCGGGDAREANRKLKHLPAWVFHGQLDTIVPIENGLQMIGALRNTGDEVRYTIYPDAGHDIWFPTYNNPELYQWLLEHRRYQAEPRRIRPTPTPRALRPVPR